VDFYEKKSSMIEPTCEQFKEWEQNGHKVNVVQMDNSRENLKQAQSNDWKLGITFEKNCQRYTSAEQAGRNWDNC
jgi:hypothetical protein